MFAQVIASFLKMLLVEALKWASSWIDAWYLKRKAEQAQELAQKEQLEAVAVDEKQERQSRSLDFLNKDRQ